MTSDALQEILAKAGSAEHRQMALAALAKMKTPTYGSDPQCPTVILEYHKDGTVRRGRMINRKFVASET